MNISFVSLMNEASSDNRGRIIVGRAPDNYPATCVLFDSRLFEYASLCEPTGCSSTTISGLHKLSIVYCCSRCLAS